ncbi:MAG TPA: hypothetical protein VGM64_01280 [Lacunisphaera sp.]
MLLLIGGLLLLGISLMVLDAAIKQAKDGYEDDLGFHQESQQWTRNASSANVEITSWDRTEGASCPLDVSSSFPRIGNTPLTPQGH